MPYTWDGMSENHPQPAPGGPGFNEALNDVMTGLGARAENDRRASETYRSMVASKSIGGVIRQLDHVAGGGALAASDVLEEKFGLENTRELYVLLLQEPHLMKTYRERFELETHVGCVDRAVAKIVDEVRVAGNAEPRKPVHAETLERATRAADEIVGNPVTEAQATNVLVVADLFDNSRRIQRLSVDTRKIAANLAARVPAMDEPAARQIVRAVLMEAAAIVHEQDGENE